VSASADTYCCVARRHFIVAIVGKTAREDPPEVADFVLHWGPPSIVVGIRYCPFCGKEIDRTQTLRIINAKPKEG